MFFLHLSTWLYDFILHSVDVYINLLICSQRAKVWSTSTGRMVRVLRYRTWLIWSGGWQCNSCSFMVGRISVSHSLGERVHGVTAVGDLSGKNCQCLQQRSLRSIQKKILRTSAVEVTKGGWGCCRSCWGPQQSRPLGLSTTWLILRSPNLSLFPAFLDVSAMMPISPAILPALLFPIYFLFLCIPILFH